VQVAKYRGLDRYDLIDSNEYGYCSLIKTCKQVLDRLEVENRTATRITSKERIERRLWDTVALRETVINAIIHNDFTNEAVPKFEIFDDRLEITSAGSIPLGTAREEFFAGYSIPRNKILMRVFKDLKIVEYLGSGMPRILKAYPKESFIFTANFIRTVFPISLEALELEQKTTVGMTVKTSVEMTAKTPDRILQLLQENPAMTLAEVAKGIGKSQRTVERASTQLVKAGRLKHIGPQKGGHWEVVEDGHA
jgi:ATP-dependent DNA helicase RecG